MPSSPTFGLSTFNSPDRAHDIKVDGLNITNSLVQACATEVDGLDTTDPPAACKKGEATHHRNFKDVSDECCCLSGALDKVRQRLALSAAAVSIPA